jgi:hypothetical protein
MGAAFELPTAKSTALRDASMTHCESVPAPGAVRLA